MTCGYLLTCYLGQVHDEVIGVGLFRCLDEVFHGDAWSAKTDVLCDGRSEQRGLLLYDADQRAKPWDVEPTDVMAI